MGSFRLAGALALAALAQSSGCSSDDPAAPPQAAAGDDAGARADSPAANGEAGTTPGAACPRAPKTGDRTRSVVVSHPFDANGGKANSYEVLRLATDGTLSRAGGAGTRFEMGNNFDSPIVFSPDGEIGVSVQDKDGSLGIFKLDESGTPTVIQAAFGGSDFYAGGVAFSHDGSRIFVVDSNRKTTGGVHEVSIACDGTPTYKGRVLDAPGAAAVALIPGTTRVAVTVASAAGVAANNDVVFLDVATSPKVDGSLPLFGDDLINSHGIAFTADGKLGLVADGNEVMETKRVGVFATEGSPKKLSVLEVDGPSGLAVSPYGNAAIVTAAGGGSVDAIHVLTIAGAGASATVTLKGKLDALVGGKPQLPTSPVVLTEGSVKGLVLVAEVEGVRRVRFEASGAVTDLGVFTIEGDLDAAVGALGVQP